MVNCVDCGEAITGTYYETDDGGKQCQKCAEKEAGFCVACGKSMLEGDGGVTIGDDHVHSSCFKCCDCGKQIDGGFLDKKKLLPKDDPRVAECKKTDWFCGDCGQKFQKAEWEKKNGGKAKTSKTGGPAAAASGGKPGVCAFCNQELQPGQKTGRLGDGTQFHSECFKCSTCSTPIKGQFIKGKNGITCMNCVPKCAGCGQNLSGQIMQAGGKSYHKQGPDGKCCFKCTHCQEPMDGGFFPDPSDESRYVCEGCYAEITENIANAKHEVEREKQIHATDEIERGHGLVWSDAYRGRPEDTLYLFDGEDKEELAKDPKMLCLFLDEDDHLHVGRAHDWRHSLNLEYLIEACKMLELNNGQDPVFSLDPADPHDLGGKEQKKRFIPDAMCNGPLGEVMFQADYFLKKFSFGDAPVAGVKFPSLFETDHSSTGARQWFIIDSAKVSLSKDRVIMVEVKMIVDARRLEMGPEGYRDAPLTMPDDPALQHAHHFSECLEQIRDKGPHCVRELYECAKAMTLAKWLIKKKKLRINKEKLMEYVPRPILDEINMVKKTTAHTAEGRKPMKEYPRLIPTLRKETKHTSVHHKEKGDGIEVEEHTQSMYGGVDLGVPVEKIVTAAEPLPVADPRYPPHPFPVLVPRGEEGGATKRIALQESMSHEDYLHASRVASPDVHLPKKRLTAVAVAVDGEDHDPQAVVYPEGPVAGIAMTDERRLGRQSAVEAAGGEKSSVVERTSGGEAAAAGEPGTSTHILQTDSPVDTTNVATGSGTRGSFFVAERSKPFGASRTNGSEKVKSQSVSRMSEGEEASTKPKKPPNMRVSRSTGGADDDDAPTMRTRTSISSATAALPPAKKTSTSSAQDRKDVEFKPPERSTTAGTSSPEKEKQTKTKTGEVVERSTVGTSSPEKEKQTKTKTVVKSGAASKNRAASVGSTTRKSAPKDDGGFFGGLFG